MQTAPTIITVETSIQAPVEVVWKFWTSPEHIIHWNAASDDWHTPRAENDLRVGGKFLTRMEARDGSFGFDFEGIYDVVKGNELIGYHLADERKITVCFSSEGDKTTVTETFEAESEHSIELQETGWQAILDNFKKYVESSMEANRALLGSRIIPAPIALVWQAWSDPQYLAKWWGPNGFFNTFFDFEFREGGPSKFIMHGPDGTDYDNELRYIEIKHHQKIILDHVCPPYFRAVVTFQDFGEKTKVTFRQIFETVEVCEALRAICEPANEQNFDRITALLAEMSEAAVTNQEFVMMRTFDAPKSSVYNAWTDPATVAKWWGPEIFSCPVCELNVRPGGKFRIVMRGPEDGGPTMDYPLRGEFGEISPDRIVMIQDATEHPPNWHDMVDPQRGNNPNPAGLIRQTVSFLESNGRTTVTLRTRFESVAIRETMDRMGMAQSWSGSLERLSRILLTPNNNH